MKVVYRRTTMGSIMAERSNCVSTGGGGGGYAESFGTVDEGFIDKFVFPRRLAALRSKRCLMSCFF